MKCTDKRGPGRRSNSDPDPDQKIEIFFLAKFINTKKICTITVKVQINSNVFYLWHHFGNHATNRGLNLTNLKDLKGLKGLKGF